MSYKNLYMGAAACLVVGALLLASLFLMKHEEKWAQFPADAKGPAPIVKVEVDRDFGFRTGDVIPITIYIKQFPGTSVDVDGLALDGDFEIRGDVKLDTRATADGAKITRVKMSVQSFAFKPVISARVSMTWNQVGERDWHEIDKTTLDLHTSPTWDGRDKLQEGHPVFVQGFHLLKTIGWLLGAIAVMVLATLYMRREWRNMPEEVDPPRRLTVYEWAMVRFDAVWLRVLAGDRSDEVFMEIDHITRKLMHVETVQISHLDIALSDHPFKKQGLYIIKTCERLLFRGDPLPDKYVMALKTAFDEIISRKIARNEEGEMETL